MHSDNLEMPMYNLNGALIFTVYVISALLLTLFITSHLFATYQRQSATERKKRDSLGQGKQLYLFSALSTLSFSILSYHMLSYLILSYRSWAIQKNIPLPQKLIGQNSLLGPGIDRVQLQIWHWLTTSTLFLAFAQTICSTFARYWWIQQALLWTMLWNLFLNVQGCKLRIPHLWAYAFIGQILPVSFAQNLFYLAILLGPPSEPQEKVWTPDLVLQVPLLALYYSLVLYLPSADNASDTGVFISMIVLIRLLLFAPLYLPLLVPNRFQIKDSTAREKFSTYVRAAWFVLLIITSLVLFETAMAPKENNFRVWNVVTAINENPAVSALGYDYVISMVSFAFWISPMGISKRNKLE